MRSSAHSGRSSQARSSRPPIDVIVRSISWSRDPCGPPSLPVTTSRCFSVIGSMMRLVAARPVTDRADVREVSLLRVAQIGDQRAGRLNRPPSALRGRSLRGRAS